MPTSPVSRKRKVTRTETSAPATAETKKVPQLTGEGLISFISGAQTNIGRDTFYNMKSEQQKALTDQHLPVLGQARPFYTLMALPQGVNDVNKQLIAWNLIQNTVRDPNLKSHEFDPTTRWENEIILEAFSRMPVPRVFDFALKLQESKVTKKRAIYLVHEWLRRNERSWPLWTIKYREEMKRVLRHFHTKENEKLRKLWRYLKYGENEGCGQLIQDYVAVQKGDKDKLAKLPATVAEGFMSKFGMSKEDFWKLFTKEGGKFTAKEARTKAESVKEAGSSTDLDINRLSLFDLLVYLRPLKRYPKPKPEVLKIIERKAGEVAQRLSFKFNKVGLILDTSVSMFGTKDQPYHPMLKGIAISLVLRHVSSEFKEYRTNGGEDLFPTLGNQSNYADCILQALKDGCDTLVIVGDGYENAPFEGATNQLLHVYKNKLDKENKLRVFHLNPVYASEAKDVRAISDLASNVGVRSVEGLNEAMFLAVAKAKPMLAVQAYFRNLVQLQSDRIKALMPPAVKEMVDGTKGSFLEV